MPRKRYTPEQIINSLREAEVLLSQGNTAKEASRHLGISEQTYYKKAIPQYNVGYGDFLARLANMEEENPGLYFCANYRGGPGLSDVLDSSLTMSQRILN